MDWFSTERKKEKEGSSTPQHLSRRVTCSLWIAPAISHKGLPYSSNIIPTKKKKKKKKKFTEANPQTTMATAAVAVGLLFRSNSPAASASSSSPHRRRRRRRPFIYKCARGRRRVLLLLLLFIRLVFYIIVWWFVLEQFAPAALFFIFALIEAENIVSSARRCRLRRRRPYLYDAASDCLIFLYVSFDASSSSTRLRSAKHQFKKKGGGGIDSVQL